MPALNLDTDADRIAERLADPGTLLVACLCAEWCGTCRDYRTAFDQLADAHPDACFAWIDIETHADQLDDLDKKPMIVSVSSSWRLPIVLVNARPTTGM